MITTYDNKSKSSYDILTLFIYIALVSVGWLAIYSVDFNEQDTSFFSLSQNYGKQLLWIGISASLGFMISLMDSKIFSAFAYIFYGLIVLLLLFVFTLGKATNGALSWIEIGSFKLQPSEFAKLATALCMAKYLDTFQINFKNTSTKVISFAIFLIPMALVLMQNDTGSALVFAAFILVLYREGLSIWLLAFGLLIGLLFLLSIFIDAESLILGVVSLGLICSLFAWSNKKLLFVVIAATILISSIVYSFSYVLTNVLKDYQLQRIYVTLGLEEDIKGVGYNVYQSKVAIGSGGLYGKGYMQGTHTRLKYVPEQNTDFIFCTIGEETGFIGSSILVILFVALLCRLVVLAERQKNKFSRVYIYCICCIFFIHFAINLGMAMGIFPVIGIPLPFISYGGSSMLSFTLMLFIALRLDAHRVNEISRSIDN